MANGKNKNMKLKAIYIVMAVGFFGVLLIFLNIYQLYHLPWQYSGLVNFEDSERKKVAWISSEYIYHLNHVMAVLERVGYTVVHSTTPPVRWNIMWSFDFPFSHSFDKMLKNLDDNQMVNHFPGLGFITLKVQLATSKLKWIPKAFKMPQEKHALIAETKLNPKNLWVQKSNDHRGIKIVDVKGLDLSAENTFVQLFVRNPLLIDGKKFDIGIYTVVTSVDPLRVYIYSEEILVRFCTTSYEPLNVDDISSYVVGDDYYAPSLMPSLQSYFNHGRYSRKESLFGYLESHGKDTKKLWRDIRQSIREIFIAKEKEIAANNAGYKSPHNFFELVRVDFVIDRDMNLWLMEVNMSPNLASAVHKENRVMYEQVLYYAFAMTGVAKYVHNIKREDKDANEMMMNDRDTMVNSEQCRKAECLSSCQSECDLCIQCVSDDMKIHFQKAFSEHINRGNYRRVLPIPKEEQKNVDDPHLVPSGKSNYFMQRWFKKKCQQDSAWCQ